MEFTGLRGRKLLVSSWAPRRLDTAGPMDMQILFWQVTCPALAHRWKPV